MKGVMSDTSLVFNLLAKDKATATLGKVKNTIGKLGTAVAAAGVAAGVGLAKIGTDFDQAFDTIQVGTGATGAALEGLKGDFKSALAETPADMAVVADAMTNLSTLTGATGEVLQGLTVQVSEASRLLGEDAKANSEAFGQSLAQWQIPAAEGEDKLDALFKATQDYGVSLGGIIGNLNNYGSVLQNADFTMEQSAALFGQLESAGLQVSRVMPGLNKAFRDWASEGKNVQDELGKTVSKIGKAESGTEALAIATEAFGAEGAQRMSTAIRSGAVNLDELSTALGGAEGLIGDTADGTDSWQEKLQKLKNEGLVAVEPLASALFDKLGEGVSVLKSVTTWAQNNTGAVKALAIAIGSVAGIILAVNIGLKVFAAAMAVKKAVVVTATAVQWAWNAAMAANPIGLIVIAIAALVAAIVLIATKTTWFQDIWQTVWGGIKTAAQAVGTWFMDTLWQKWILGTFNNIVGKAQSVRDSVVGFFVSMKDRLLAIPGQLRSGFAKVAGWLTAPFRRAFNSVSGLWNRTLGRVSFTVPGWVPGVGGRGWSFPRMPRLAKGGIVTEPTIAMIGEGNRDEAVVPLPRGPNEGFGGKTVLEFVGDGSRAAELVVELIRETVRVRGRGDVQVTFGGG